MKTHALLLTTVAVLSLGGAAFAADKTTYESKTKVESDSKGNYNEENKTQKTNAAGSTTHKEKVEVDVHANGDVDNTVKTEKTTDPKGLMNKTSTKTTDTQDVKHDGVTKSTHKKVVNGKTVESVTETTK
jgi:hypothetical protein